MDCRTFRKEHFAYLDDTLPGDVMAAAQRHVLACDSCAAHDTLVRRSLMAVRNLPSIEPSEAFRERLALRLAECREAPVAADLLAQPRTSWPARSLMVVAVSAVVGTAVWSGLREEEAPVIAMAPVVASQPAPTRELPYLTPAMVQAMATGNPMWPATLLLEEAPTQFVTADYSFAVEQ